MSAAALQYNPLALDRVERDVCRPHEFHAGMSHGALTKNLPTNINRREIRSNFVHCAVTIVEGRNVGLLSPS